MIGSSESWPAIERFFREAVALPPADRVALLNSIGAEDPLLRTSLERLLRAHDAPAAFFEQIDPERAAELLELVAGEPHLPETIDRYRVRRQLGRGGMGVVLLAEDPRLERPVALKLLPVHLHADPRAEGLLLDEARAACALDHPHIATIYEVGQAQNGQPFIAMAYYDGVTLRERLAHGRLADEEIIRIAVQIADGLAAAHAKGVVHRDIKPENILLTRDGRVKILDFGLARMGIETAPGFARGTVAYMSPEQVCGEPVDAPSDVWSLGVVLYELLTGVRPFTGDDEAELLRGIEHELPAPLVVLRPETDPRLVALVERCLWKSADERQSAADVLALLGEITATRAHGVKDERSPHTQRGRRWLAVLALGALVLAAAAASTRWPRAKVLPDEAEPALLAIFPFVATGGDTALQRLGRELSVTLSTTIGGVAGMQTVEPITLLAHVERADPVRGVGDAAGIVRRLGAGRIVYGALVRSGSEVRLDARIYDTRTLEPLGRSSAAGAAEDIASLTDRVALALLPELGAAAGGTAPSRAALTTQSVTALGAFLEGERALALGQVALAPEHFARAIEADSTFWFAYWRYYWTRGYTDTQVDNTVFTTILEHRHEFPEPDRLLVEARLAWPHRARFAALEALTRSFPSYWPGWFELAMQLVHSGPYLGYGTDAMRSAVVRTIALNPNFVPAWERLLWVNELDGDTAAAGHALARLQEFGRDTVLQRTGNLSPLGYYECLHSLAGAVAVFTPECAPGVELLGGYNSSMPPERLALGVTKAGYHRAAIEFADSIDAHPGVRPDVVAAHELARALAWAGRGEWNEAIAAAERYARTAPAPDGPIWAYGLSVAGAWLGALEPGRTTALRDLAVRAPAARAEDARAELAWLDGLLAYARRDRAALATSIRTLGENDAPAAAGLRASLAAFEAAVTGDSAGAARWLARLEWAHADSAWQLAYGQRHPYVISVNRLAAGRWLLQAGDTAEAARLLLWHRGIVTGATYPLLSVNIAIGNLALYELGRIEQARGRPQLARQYFQQFVDRYDRPPLQHRRMVAGAREFLARDRL